MRPDERDYKQEWEDMWKDICTNPDGSLNLDAIQRELSDYSGMMHQVSMAYDDVTGGRISKPNTMAFEVTSVVNQRFEEYAKEAIEEAVENGELIRVTSEHSASQKASTTDV